MIGYHFMVLFLKHTGEDEQELLEKERLSVCLNKKMSNHEETVKCYQSLLLEEIPTEWVDGVWDGNFCEAVTSTDVLKQLITRPKRLSQVVHVTRTWIETRNDSQSKLLILMVGNSSLASQPLRLGEEGCSELQTTDLFLAARIL